jgi:hypothetical protein
MTKYLLRFFYLLFTFSCSFFASAAIVVDGKLDEELWESAQVLENFVITEPLTGERSPYKTIAKITSDENGLYIGVINHQPTSIPRVKTRFARDSWMAADRNVVIIDFDGNGKTAYEFTVSLSNSQQDGVVSEETKFQYDWDGTWYSATSEDGDYWINEIQIPWSTVPMTKAEGIRHIGVYVAQVIHQKKLRTASIDASWSRSTFVSDLQKVEVATYSKQTIDVFPYLTVQHNQIDRESETKMGIDLFWKPTSNQQVSLAINPDFGQVESDNLVVNFSSIESYFSEKRPFFTENQSLFTKKYTNGGHLIHTRRIGGGSDNGDYATTDIDYALKYSNFGESFDVGGFIASEADEGSANGRTYAMGHIEKQLDKFKIGYFATHVDRPDIDRKAFVNALDLQWQYDNNSRVTGLVTLSDIKQYEDEEDKEFNTKGESIDLSYTSMIDDKWRNSLEYIYMSDDFELNDMGFMGRNDLKRLSGTHKYIDRNFNSKSSIRERELKVQYNYRTNAENQRLESQLELGTFINYKDTSNFYIELKRIFNSLEDRTLQDVTLDNGDIVFGGTFKKHSRWGTFSKYEGVQQGKFRNKFKSWIFTQELSGLAYHLNYEPTWNIQDNLTINGGLSYTNNSQWLIWRSITEPEVEYENDPNAVYGEAVSFQQNQFKAYTNLNWLISDGQELRVKFEWIGIKADVNSGYRADDSGYLHKSNTTHNSFELSNTALQVRYRYELAPLSNIFVVWSRGGNYELDSLEESYTGMLNKGWSEKFADQFLIKVRYRF